MLKNYMIGIILILKLSVLYKGFDSVYVPGRKNCTKGLGVLYDEFIIFNPYQALPYFEVDYDLV
jgi:hypothetical protein